MTSNQWIDLRSDTVTQPCDQMRKAMLKAPVGDDVYGEDPTVNRLQELMAELTGQEAALFISSGVQSNLVGLLTHCQRGEEYIVAQDAHTYQYEGGGAAVLGSIQPQPIESCTDGTLDLNKVSRVIKANDIHFARSKLLVLENTIGGKVLPQPYVNEAIHFCRKNSLSIHLDGARIANAAVKQNCSILSLVKGFDSVSICLSKGLGAPVGSLLCASKPFIQEAKRWRKMLGGGMRQAGILAAAGIYALENNINRLQQDHQNAALLAQGLTQIDGLIVEPVQSNILFMTLPKGKTEGLNEYLLTQGIKASIGENTRLVTHLDISEMAIKKTVSCFQHFFSSK